MQQPRKQVLFDAHTIQMRVKELGGEISLKYPEGNILFIGILKGAFMFLADLVRAVDVSCEIDFAKISSYGTGTVSSGKLELIVDVTIPVADRHVILVDDIIDTGLTLKEYSRHLAKQSPRTLEIAGLLSKTARREKDVHIDYCGFEIEDGFIVGYGLDCNEQYRHEAALYILGET